MKIFSFNDPDGRILTMVLCLILLLPLISHAAADTPTPSAVTAAPEAKKIHITADRLISNTPDNQAEFIGNVRASQGETLITTDSLKIFFSGTSKTGQSSPAQSLEKLVATGNVEIKFDNRLAVAPTGGIYNSTAPADPDRPGGHGDQRRQHYHR